MRTLLFLILLVSSLASLHAKPSLVHDADAMQVKVYKLQNGLTIYLTRNTEHPNFYAEIVVRAGSRHDPADCTGLAHYLEHLLFKGTRKMGTLDYEKEKPHLEKIIALYEKHFRETDPEKRKVIYREINAESKLAARYAVANDIDRIYKSIGATKVNAHTYYEETVYKVQVPSNKLRQWAAIEFERFNDPVFRLFHTELETVYEEKNQSLDSGQDQLSEAVQKHLFPKHPYSQTVLGSTAHLKNPSIKRIREYYNRHYTPSNMAVFISGDIEIDTTLAVLEKTLGKWKKRAAPETPSLTPAVTPGVQRIKIRFEEEESITLAWRTCPANHKDVPALTMLDMILDNSVAGLINLNLVQAQKVRAAGSYPLYLNEAGAQYLYGTPRDGQSLDELEKLLLEQVEHIKKGEFEDWILPAILADLKSDKQEYYEDNESRVTLMRDAYIHRQAWDDAVQDITRLSAVTKEDVIRVANTYLNDTYVSAQLINGKSKVVQVEKPQIDAIPLNSGAESEFARKILGMSYEAIPPYFIKQGRDYRKTHINGITYYTTRNPINNLFTITWTFPAGLVAEKNLELAFMLLDKAGTEQYSLSELGKKWYQLDLTPSYSVNESYTEISLSGAQASMEEGVKLFWQWLRHPVVDQKTLDKLIADVIGARKDELNNPAAIKRAMYRRSRFGQQSLMLTRTSSEDLKKLTVPDLTDTVKRLFTLPHSISYVGKLKESSWRKHIPQLSVTSSAPKLTDRTLKRDSKPNSIHIDFYHREMAQAHVWIEMTLPRWKEEDYPVMHLFNEYFDGGMSGIVFQELRESRALAYTAYAFLSHPRWKNDPYLAVGSIGCQADKTYKSITHFIHLFDELPVSANRFSESKASIDSSIRAGKVGFRNIAPTVLSWQRAQFTINPRQKTFRALSGLELSDMTAYYQSNVKNRPKRICIVGDRNRINIEALKKLGTFTELKASDIFTP